MMRSNRLLFAEGIVHQGSQGHSSASVVLNGAGEFREGVGELEVEIHRRTVVRWAGYFWGQCSCGFLTTGHVTERGAEIEPCEVESILADSARRKRLLYAGRG